MAAIALVSLGIIVNACTFLLGIVVGKSLLKAQNDAARETIDIHSPTWWRTPRPQ